jgi:hypothetical protein
MTARPGALSKPQRPRAFNSTLPQRTAPMPRTAFRTPARRQGYGQGTPEVAGRVARTPLRPRSRKTEQVYAQERRPLVARILAERKWCEIRWSDAVCQRRSDCVHEVISRGRGGSITDEANCLASCGPCNTAVSDNPAEAERRGLLKHSWDREATP